MEIITKSQGIKRTLASILAAASALATTVPALEPYAPVLTWLAGIFGAVGVAHALVGPSRP